MSNYPCEGEFLKCDAVGCDHFEMIAITIDVVDRACPKCGANLCTKEDYIAYHAVHASRVAATEVALRADPSTPLVLRAINVHAGEVKVAEIDSVGHNPFPNSVASKA